MKKLFTILTMIFFAGSLSAIESTISSKKKKPLLAIQFEGGLLLPQDRNFKEIYGNTQTLYGGRIKLNMIKNIYLFAGIDLTSKKTKFSVEDLSIDAESKQTFFSFGCGYLFGQPKSINWYLEAAAVPVKIKEKAMDREAAESVFGFSASAGLNKSFGRRFVTGLFVRYVFASKKISSQTVKPGGLFVGGSLGFQF